MKWKVRLNGDSSGLCTLAKSFTNDPKIFEDDDNFYLWASEFEDLEESDEVRQASTQIIKSIRSFGLQNSLSTEDLQASHVYKIKNDGTEDIYVRTEPAKFKVSVSSARVTSTDEKGNKSVYRPADKVYELTQLSSEDKKVQELANLLNNGYEWVNLYRIYEFIQDNIKRNENITDLCWWSETEKDQFKQTANSRDAIGDDARHGQKRVPAPEDPMSHSEAKRLVDTLIDDWLEHRKQLQN